ncbi:MAG: hypothetical protein WCX61_04840, partial [Candidatus Peribacteraceae bacterium]
MKNFDIQTILADLYTIDPTLKDHEAELIPLIETLLKERPDAKPDKHFVQTLRRMLHARSQELANTPSVSSTLFPFSTMKFVYAIAGALVGIAITGPAVYFSLNNPSVPFEEEPSGTLSFSVQDEAPQAFGTL